MRAVHFIADTDEYLVRLYDISTHGNVVFIRETDENELVTVAKYRIVG